MSDVAAIRNTGSKLVGQQVRDTGLGDGPSLTWLLHGGTRSHIGTDFEGAM